jgi:hypothetical protein
LLFTEHGRTDSKETQLQVEMACELASRSLKIEKLEEALKELQGRTMAKSKGLSPAAAYFTPAAATYFPESGESTPCPPSSSEIEEDSCWSEPDFCTPQ